MLAVILLVSLSSNATNFGSSNDLEAPWGALPAVTPKQAFGPIKKLMMEDMAARLLLGDVNQRLRSRGIGDVEDIVAFCDDNGTTATAFYSANVVALDARPALPGHPEIPWKEGSLQQAKSAFTWKILRLPFMEILLLAGTPAVCARRNLSIRSAYDNFVHELTHFYFRDAFFDTERLMTLGDLQGHISGTVLTPGGELDAFKAGIGVEVRLLKRLSPLAELPYPYANSAGEIVDEPELKKRLFKNYGDYYNSPSIRTGIVGSLSKYYRFQIGFLKNEAVQAAEKADDSQLVSAIQSEIENIEAKDTALRKTYPNSFSVKNSAGANSSLVDFVNKLNAYPPGGFAHSDK